MFVERVRIENLKCFEKTQVNLNHPRRDYGNSVDAPGLKNVNLFVGENGAGKTALCQAVCIAVLKTILSTNASGLNTEGFIRVRGKFAETEASLDLSEVDDTVGRREAHAAIKQRSGTEYIEGRGQPAKWSDVLFNKDSPAIFIAAYGASRRTERPEAYNERLRGRRYQRVASLFEPHVGLLPLSLALEYCAARLDEVISLINQLLPKVGEDRHSVQLIGTDYVPEGGFFSFGEPEFDADGVSVPLSGLSDGYRLHIGWIADLVCHIARVLPPEVPLAEIEGVVIVDEIDLLLHAEWQRSVVPTLARTFPNLQFLITTHSPVVAGTVEGANIFVLDRIGPHTSEITECDETILGRSIDEILVRLFGLRSPRAHELEAQLRDLESKAAEGDFDAAVSYLRTLRIGAEQR